MSAWCHITQVRLLQEQAEDTLALFQERFGYPVRPSLQVELMARALFGLRVENRKLGRFGKRVIGALSVTERTIYVDERCNWYQRAFAVAHELGHWILHEDHHCGRLDIEDNPTVPLSQILESRRARTKTKQARLREIEANRFAAALLVPYTLLLNEAEQFEIIDARAVSKLARTFGVANQMIRYRIRELSDHQLWTGPRIAAELLAGPRGYTRRPARETTVAGVDYL